MRRTRVVRFLIVLCCLPLQGAADAPPFIALGSAARPLVDIRAAPADAAQSPAQASLFAGQGAASFLAPWPDKPPSAAPRQGARLDLPRVDGWQVQRLRALIAKAEAGRDGYDAVQHGARIRPAKPPTAMTLQEVYDWIDRTPGQPHAIGRYQFIPPTLRRLVRSRNVPLTARFSPDVQDHLADGLLEEAGIAKVRAGEMTRARFMHNLARIWAGLPTASGKSYYDGYAGNKATMSWAEFDREMRQIFPG